MADTKKLVKTISNVKNENIYKKTLPQCGILSADTWQTLTNTRHNKAWLEY